MANDWILRRVILDDSFVPAMNYLSTKVSVTKSPCAS